MGKRQIGQMQPFELVLTLIIADLATIPMAEVSVPVLHGIVPLLTLVVIHFMLALFSRLSQTISKVVSGKPVILINPKGIDYEAMKKLNLSTDDIFAALRECGYFSISQVQYAIMETNGKISVMPKADSAPVTNSDLKIDAQESFIPIMLVSDGKIMKENCTLAGMSDENISSLLKEHHCSKLKEVILLCVDEMGEGYLQVKGKEGKTFQTKRLVNK
ncbi:MAG: DUF421 domain-containing protein [Clostridia bacterium]|nr:DUF421 domain-containing protein [Clostridia bacterium]